MLKFFRLLILTFILIGISMQQGNCADKYYWLYSSDTQTVSLDTTTFNVSNNDNSVYLDAWIKYQYNEDGVQKEISRRQKVGLPVIGFEKLSYSLIHVIYSMNQSRKMIKYMDYTIYDTNNSVLAHYIFPTPTYLEITPHSETEYIADRVFNYYTEYIKK